MDKEVNKKDFMTNMHKEQAWWEENFWHYFLLWHISDREKVWLTLASPPAKWFVENKKKRKEYTVHTKEDLPENGCLYSDCLLPLCVWYLKEQESLCAQIIHIKISTQENNSELMSGYMNHTDQEFLGL